MKVCPKSKLTLINDSHNHHLKLIMCRLENASKYVEADHLVQIISEKTELLKAAERNWQKVS